MNHAQQNIELHLHNHVISDALNAVATDNYTQTIAFAGLWSLLSEGHLNMNYNIQLLTKILDMEEQTVELAEDVLATFKELQAFQAAPGAFLCDGEFKLNPELEPFMDTMRAELLELIPETQRALPAAPRTYKEHGGIRTVKSKLQRSFQDMPQVYHALDALNAVGYATSADILALTNLPRTLEYKHNYSARQHDMFSTEWLQGTFYFRHTMDSRGRVYARSILINPQGDSFDKAALVFAEAKPLGEKGLGALAVHYANCSGYDKLSFAERILWAKTNGLHKAHRMSDAHGDWSIIEPLIEDKKHAFEEYTAALEFFRACMSLHPEEYMSNIVVHQDATTSGFQFGAALLGDRATADLTNITLLKGKADKPADLYGEMATHLTTLINNTGEFTEYLPVINRSFCKKPIMTTGYGAGIKTIMKHIGEYLRDLGENDLANPAALEQFKPMVAQALEMTASSMLALSGTLREAAKELLDNGEEAITWRTPDGFQVFHQYRDNSARKVAIGKITGIRARVQGEVDPIDHIKMATALPPNFVHSMDGQMVRTVAKAAYSQNIALSAIHDSFGTHAGTFHELNLELRHAFAQTLDFDWIGEFNKTNDCEVTIEKGDYNHDEALCGTYMFS